MKPPKPDPKLFTGLAGRVVKLFDPHTEADPVAVAAQFLVAFGNAVGRGPVIRIGATEHHLNENVLIVGTSARARKGDSWGCAQRTLRDADPDWAMNIASGLSSGEGLIHAVRDRTERINQQGETVVADEGVKDKRLLVVESEFSGATKAFRREGNILSNVIRDAWDCKPVLRTLTKTSPTRATNAHISIIGHSTPEDLEKYLGDTEAANGLGNRFLILLVHRAKKLANPGQVDPADVEALAGDVRKALERARLVSEVRRTEAAVQLWAGMYPSLTADTPGLLGKLLARAEAHVSRLAAIYALTDKAEEVDVQHLQAALALWDHAEASTARIFADRTGNLDADRIREAVKPGERLTSSKLRKRVFQGHIDADRLEAAVHLLELLGHVRVETEPTRGRSRTVIVRCDPDAGDQADASPSGSNGGPVVHAGE